MSYPKMLYINGKEYVCNEIITSKEDIASLLNLSTSEFYLLSNGKIISEIPRSEPCRIEVVLRLLGGKGGFGSMLRAIGAQIEKTTNREACRDLSGRRLRDINEEKRLKAWISQQADREREVEDRRKKKLERLCQKPKHEFRDDTYEKERTELTDRVEDALQHGLNMDKGKRKSTEPAKNEKSKKPCLWLGSDEDLSTTDEEDDGEDNSYTPKQSTSKIDDVSHIDNVNIVDTQENSNNSEKDTNETTESKDSNEINDDLQKHDEIISSDLMKKE